MSYRIVVALILVAAVSIVCACSNYPPGYCSALVQAYEDCKRDAECWENRGKWGTVNYMAELNQCTSRVNRGMP